jgi:DNA-directed RNA polymerase specialized sigma24 family protein
MSPLAISSHHDDLFTSAGADHGVSELHRSTAYWRTLADDDRELVGAVPPRAPMWPSVRALIERHLTPRQQQVLELFYLRGLDQTAVGRLLGISQQAVSEHLFGKLRHGRRVGGLIRKLRRLCDSEGVARPRAGG